MLMDTIRTDLTAAMKARDALKLRSLRAVIAAVQEVEVSGKEAKSLDDAGVQKVIASQVKRRIEAAEAFDSGGRAEKAADERDEIQVLEAYLPQQLSEHEVIQLIEPTLAAEGISAAADMGKAMKAVNQKVAGRADGRMVADAVKARLS